MRSRGGVRFFLKYQEEHSQGPISAEDEELTLNQGMN